MAAMIPAFDPACINIHVSMNRVVVADLPGLPEKLRGKTGYQLLSAEALAALIKPHREALRIAADVPDSDLPRQLDQVLLRGWGDQVLTVTSIASAFASRLAYLLATLKRGDAVNRAARPEWDDSYWAHWAHIKTVILGGGLASGILGGVAAQLAEETILPSLDVSDLRVQTSTFGARLPLYGVARYAPTTCRRAYVLDFGNTAIKRGRALYSEQELTAIEELPALPTTPRPPAELFEFMVETLADPQVEHDGVIRLCIAAYMDEDGHVQPDQLGLYGPLATVTTNLSADLSAAVSTRLGRTVSVRVFHDGTAAGIVYAGVPHGAVLMMGTALGIGYPPTTNDGLWRLKA